MVIDKNLEKEITKLFENPCVPFSIKSRAKHIKTILLEKGLTNILETPYTIIAKTGSENSAQRILISTHLDHPGFVFKNSKEAIALGTLYFEKINLNKIPSLAVYDKEGKFICKTKIVKVSGKDKEQIFVKDNPLIKKNYFGLWDLPHSYFTKESFFGRSNDNDLPTAILLNNITTIKNSKYQYVFIFTKNEEIVQLGSYNLAKANTLKIKPSDILINLESMKVLPIGKKPQSLDYESGLVLNISERGIIYSKKDNLAESIINNICDKNGIRIQNGLAGGSTDAWPFAKYSQTRNIVTLNIPNEYKHNVNNQKVTLEKASINYINDMDKLLGEILHSDISEYLQESKAVFEKDLDNKDLQHIKQKDLLLSRLAIAYKGKSNRGYFWPESFRDKWTDFSYKLLSYLFYYVKKLLKKIDTSQRIE